MALKIFDLPVKKIKLPVEYSSTHGVTYVWQTALRRIGLECKIDRIYSDFGRFFRLRKTMNLTGRIQDTTLQTDFVLGEPQVKMCNG